MALGVGSRLEGMKSHKKCDGSSPRCHQLRLARSLQQERLVSCQALAELAGGGGGWAVEAHQLQRGWQ